MKRSVIYLAVMLASQASLMAFLQAPAAINPDRPLGVCEVLRDPAKYKSKVIEIEGEWSSGMAISENCTPFELKSGAHRWPTAIYLAGPRNVYGADESADWAGVTQSFLNLAYQGAQVELGKYAPSAKQRTVAIRVVGRLDVHFDATQSMLLLDQFGEPFGFGPQGLYPVQLVIVGVKKITLMADGKAIPGF